MLKTLFASVMAAAATVFLSVGAAAGATPQHFNLSMPYECFSKGDYSICVVAKGEETIVQTPSGNFSGVVNMTSSYAVSYQGSVIGAGTDSFHEHVLYANNFTVLKEGGIHQNSTFSDGTTTCTFSADIHVTNLDPVTGTGHIQYWNVTTVCV
jgi:hypothetical protein